MQSKPSTINIIWLSMIVCATVVAAYTGNMAAVTKASFDSAKSAVTLAIGLIGSMALWLGIMKVVEVGGMMRIIAQAIKPVMIRIFPDVPAEHPAMSAIIMNMAANALGLGNAATPMGIKAMHELDKLNQEKGTATNAMCLFLAINTSSVTLLPLGVITVRAGAGATSPASILLPSIIATLCSTTIAIIAAKFLARKDHTYLSVAAKPIETEKENETKKIELSPPGIIGKSVMIALIFAFIGSIFYRFFAGNTPDILSMQFFTSLSNWLIPVLICALLLFGYFKGVHIYETVTDGAKEGFSTAIRIIPFMVAIFVAIGMFRASGAMDILILIINKLHILSIIGMPPEALPMALMRPLSGSGAFGLMAETVAKEPNSFLSFLVSTMQGSTETTFYVLAVYFGAIGIKRTRHALPAALLADVAGIISAVIVCRFFFSVT